MIIWMTSTTLHTQTSFKFLQRYETQELALTIQTKLNKW